MSSSGMLRRVALVRTYVSEELNAPFIRVTRIGELGTTLAVTCALAFLCSVCRLLNYFMTLFQFLRLFRINYIRVGLNLGRCRVK
jgi:hypothetical protein